eukprot:UN07238
MIRAQIIQNMSLISVMLREKVIIRLEHYHIQCFLTGKSPT